jgi:Anti-anti-sigma regulatory factor (antagonist of anti-sigma factor)
MADEGITVTKVRDVLMVTMPPDPDDPTVTALQEKVLRSMGRFNPKGLILDISAVDTLDSFFARTIVETAKMVELMGGITVIAGMRPSVAITATQLGFTFGTVQTALDVDRGLTLLNDLQQR